MVEQKERLRATIVPLHITFCQNCTRDNPAFLHTIHRLQRDYPAELCIIEMHCMAACDTPPTILLEDDYYPSITPHNLCQQVRAHIDAWRAYEAELAIPV